MDHEKPLLTHLPVGSSYELQPAISFWLLVGYPVFVIELHSETTNEEGLLILRFMSH